MHEPGPTYITNKHIDNSGKMVILNKLFMSMKVKVSCILIFRPSLVKVQSGKRKGAKMYILYWNKQ